MTNESGVVFIDNSASQFGNDYVTHPISVIAQFGDILIENYTTIIEDFKSG
jgi:hypothetical protein